MLKKSMVNRTSKHFLEVGFKRLALTTTMLVFVGLTHYGYSAEPIGFGRNTTGGKGGKEVTVTTAEALKAAAESSEPMIITVKGKIVHDVTGGDDDARIFVKSNKTIQGFDVNASVDANFNAVGSTNVIFRNITLSNEIGKGTGDGIEFTKECTNIWIDHVTFGQSEDGALDFKKGSDSITVSWCRFAYTSATHDHNFANLIGHDDTETTDRGKLHVTMHHNWYDKNVIERMPRVRYGRVHVFNNYYASERTNYVIGVGVESEILLEASYFKDQGATTWYNWYEPNKCTEPCANGKIHWTPDNIFSGNTVVSTWAPNSVVFSPSYPYSLDKAADVPSIVSAHAGSHGGEPQTPTPMIWELTKGIDFKFYPNQLDFQLNKATNLNVVLYNPNGEMVTQVMQGSKTPGSYSIHWDSFGLAQGLYFAVFQLNAERHKIPVVIHR